MKSGEKLKFFRLLNGLPQDDIAGLLSVHQRNVAMIESGRFLLRSDLIKSLTYAFSLSPTYYHFIAPPIFTADVVFFAIGELSSRDMQSISSLLVDFINENKVNNIFVMNKSVIVLEIHGQMLFIQDNLSNALYFVIQNEKIAHRTVNLDISISDQHVERIYNFPFPTVKVAEFIKVGLSNIGEDINFTLDAFMATTDIAKKHIIGSIRENKIKEIKEIMSQYHINPEDLRKSGTAR